MAKSKKPSSVKSILDLSPAEVAKRVEQAKHHLAEIHRLVPGLPTLSADDRLHSLGKLRAGETTAMRAILDAMDAHPKYFAAIAADDHGDDPKKVETAPSRDDLARREALATIAPSLEELATSVNDALLVLGEHAREVTIPAYGIARTNAEFDPELAGIIGPAVTFYGESARVRARNAKKQRKANQTP